MKNKNKDMLYKSYLIPYSFTEDYNTQFGLIYNTFLNSKYTDDYYVNIVPVNKKSIYVYYWWEIKKQFKDRVDLINKNKFIITYDNFVFTTKKYIKVVKLIKKDSILKEAI